MLISNTRVIQKIIELKNIDFLELLKYGLEHTFISDAFCSSFAIELMNQKILTNNPTIIELASLIQSSYENQYEKAQSIITEATKKTSREYENRRQLYNKIWFYLFQVDNFIKLNIMS